MATITIDTYDFINSLKAAGMPEEQAKAISEGLKHINFEHIATKGDIKDLEIKIESIKSDIFKWIVPLMLGQAALIAALVKLL